jgi:hypothetical protein
MVEKNKDFKEICEYDCFHLVNNKNKQSRIFLALIIFGVNYAMNEITNNRDNEMLEKITSKKLKTFLDSYDKYQNSQTKVESKYKYTQNEILNNYLNFNKNKNKYKDLTKNYLQEFKPRSELIMKSSKLKLEDIIKSSKSLKSSKSSKRLKNGGTSLAYDTVLNNFCINNPVFIRGADINAIYSYLLALPQTTPIIDLLRIIRDNSQEHDLNYRIDFQKYNPNYYNVPLNISQTHFFYWYTKCYEYNRDIVLSYEALNYQYSNNLRDYIAEQDRYIQTLTTEQKNIIKDFTRPRTYNLLHAYISDPSPGFLQRYKRRWTLSQVSDRLGNSFCDIITCLFPHVFSTNNTLLNSIRNKNFGDDADPSYNILTEDEWAQIFYVFFVELNKIILNAPVTTKPFLCYRGSSNDYINQNTTYTDPSGNIIDVFLSNTRTSSISFSFQGAKEFYDLENDHNKRTMYRVLVTVGCKLLFASSLTDDYLRKEMEFIVPSHHVFGTTDLFTKKQEYNSIKNKGNVCLDPLDKLNSKDIILLPY